MNENTQQPTDADGSGPLGGERLAAARRAHEISATDIAKELHLDEFKIRALEQNNFAVLGAPVFAKGHLRKYAELVGVPADDVLADYYELNRTAGAPPVVGPVRKIRRDISLGPWITGGVIVIILAGTAWWWFTRGPALPLTQSGADSLAAFVSNARDDRVQDGPAVSSAIVSEPEPEPPVEVEELPPPETMLALSAAPVSEADPFIEETGLLPQVYLELSFSGDCWTEVTDASGRSLFYDLGTAGRVVTLAGDEPLQVVLGDSENVSITVEGRDYPIPDSIRRGRLARLTINNQ
jgi:cytoskeleton protein RodZ